MKVKKYTGSTMAEIMKKIRSDLGVDAVILNSREVKQGGFLGMFKKNFFEVVAAIDPEPLNETNRKDTSLEQEIRQTEPKVVESIKEENNVLEEIKYLKKMLQQQVNTSGDIKQEYAPVFDYLLKQEIEYDIAKQIIMNVEERFTKRKVDPSSIEIVEGVQGQIERRLAQTTFNGISYDQQIIHFVGPTGVGKTTTLAKVAANSILKDKKKVALITADTYRIAAIDQLKTYAHILNTPVEVVYSSDDYQEAIKKFRSYDLILVDTAGRNYREDKFIEELKGNLNSEENYHLYLVLSLTAKPKDVIDIFGQFRNLGVDNVIFTKFDETEQYGSMLNIALQNDINISYITNGQDVPDDLMIPSAKKISTYVMDGFFK